MTRSRRAFTIVELLVALLIGVTILVCLSLFVLTSTKAEVHGAQVLDSLQSLQVLLDRLHDDVAQLSPAPGTPPAEWISTVVRGGHLELSFARLGKLGQSGAPERGRVTYELHLPPPGRRATPATSYVIRRTEGLAAEPKSLTLAAGCLTACEVRVLWSAWVDANGRREYRDALDVLPSGAHTVDRVRLALRAAADARDDAGRTISTLPIELNLVPRELIRALRQHWIAE